MPEREDSRLTAQVAQDAALRGDLQLHSEFQKFWVGQLISRLGGSVTTFALPLLVYHLTGSALDLGVVTAATYLPYPLVGLLLGALADRLDRRRLMIAVDLARALVMLGLALLALSGGLSMGWLVASALVNSALSILFDAAEIAALPALVARGDLVAVNGRILALNAVAEALGPALAGVLITFTPIGGVLLADAVSFLASAASLAVIRTGFNGEGFGRDGRPPPTSLFREAREGLRYVLTQPVLRAISVMFALVHFVGSTRFAQLVLFADRQYHATAGQLGLLYAAGSAGVALLALLAGPLQRRLSFGTLLVGALLLNGLSTLGLVWTNWYVLALPLWALTSGSLVLIAVYAASLRQLIVPEPLLGRVVSVAGVLAWSAIPVGSALGGALIERTRQVALVYGAMGALVVMIALGFARYLAVSRRAGGGQGWPDVQTTSAAMADHR
ncbi:MFS transporter [Deinococcus sp.]|uniref:MFS transporter n=1 Tax=Deinococcus sp. TaxID=47478 RepID=UPI003C799DBB